MADTDKIVEELSNLSVLEISDLVKTLEDKWGVSAAAPAAVAVAAPSSGGGEAAEEKSDFNVILKSFGSNKIAVIKAVREAVSGLGLADAKKIVESAPETLKESVPKEEAEEMKKKLEEAGAEVELK